MRRFHFITGVPVLMMLSGVAMADVPPPAGYRMDNYNAPVPESVPGGGVVHTAALRLLIDQRKPLLIDVLPAPRRPDGLAATAPWMPLPHRDIPGSVWLPDVGRGALSETMERWFHETLIRLSHGDMARPIVFYCRPQCWMSWNATKRAAAYGFNNVLWYPDGVDGWESGGLPSEIATPIGMNE